MSYIYNPYTLSVFPIKIVSTEQMLRKKKRTIKLGPRMIVIFTEGGKKKINKDFGGKGFLVGNQARLDCGGEKLFPYESFLPASRGEIKHSQSYLRRCAP